MAYTALTCEELEQPLETLFRKAMLDNGDGSYSLQTVAVSGALSFTLTSGSVTDAYTYRFDLDGRQVFVRNGFEGSASDSNLVWCVVLTDGGSGLGWNVTDGSGEVLYFGLGDVPHPSDVDNWSNSGLTGTNPLPVIS
jgi:hypothetical protein